MNVNVNVFQRQFVNEIRKLDDMERIISKPEFLNINL